MDQAPLISDDRVVMGILLAILGFVFWSSSRPSGFWKRFYSIVPSVLMCYFLPSLLSTTGVISGDVSQLYNMAKNYLLPTALVLLTLSIDFQGIKNLGPKALIMFFTGTVGIIIGGPLTVLIFAPRPGAKPVPKAPPEKEPPPPEPAEAPLPDVPVAPLPAADPPDGEEANAGDEPKPSEDSPPADS